MITLLRRYLRPYTRPISLVMVLLLIQAIANLYLPELYADIINNGVSKGDTAYIIKTGGYMLIVTFALMIAAIIGVYWSARISMGMGRDVRCGDLPPGGEVQPGGGQPLRRGPLITRNTNDVTQVQQFVLMALNMMIPAPIMLVGGVIMALRQDVPLSGILLFIIPDHGRGHRRHHVQGGPAVPGDAGQDRPHQPGHARDPGRRPRHPRIRAHRARGGTLRRRQPDLMDTGLRVNRFFAITLPALI